MKNLMEHGSPMSTINCGLKINHLDVVPLGYYHQILSKSLGLLVSIWWGAGSGVLVSRGR